MATTMAMTLAVAGALAGCASTSRVTDQLTRNALLRGQQAVAILGFTFEGQRCKVTNALLAQESQPGLYRGLRPIKIVDAWPDAGGIPQVRLKPGTYHIVFVSCGVGARVFKVGQPASNFALSPHYRQSLASFTVGPGEIVNLGMLRLSGFAGRNAARVDVVAMPPGALAMLRRQRPNLAAQMVSRAMVAGAGG
ncbi:MAG: hypothetical protein AAFR04_09485 [Pseudomonadota bacterium]